jgi:hypothetical protein
LLHPESRMPLIRGPAKWDAGDRRPADVERPGAAGGGAGRSGAAAGAESGLSRGWSRQGNSTVCALCFVLWMSHKNSGGSSDRIHETSGCLISPPTLSHSSTALCKIPRRGILQITTLCWFLHQDWPDSCFLFDITMHLPTGVDGFQVNCTIS